MKYKIFVDGHGNYDVKCKRLFTWIPVKKFKWYEDAQEWIKREKQNERI